MSIKKQMILLNIGVIVVPIVGFIVAEMIIAYVLFTVLKREPSGPDLQFFFNVRLLSLILVFVVTNGLLTLFVSRRIITPIKSLSSAAKRISRGDLAFRVSSDRSDELGELSNTFEEMRLSLMQAKLDQERYERNRQELITSISHDLSTPLTSIKGYVKGIRDGIANTPEKLERYMDSIYKTADDMDGLVENLFLYSKLDVNQPPFHYEYVDLRLFFEDFIDELAFDLEREDGKAALHVNEEASYVVKADREQLKRVVMNIIQNSLKYMNKEHKEIGVILKSEGTKVVVEIKDNGSGVAKEDLTCIFDGFYRTDASRNSKTGGSGLGLAIVKKIVEEHGGEVWASSELGQGLSIYFTLERVSS